MTQEEKRLLFQDLCGRLSYGVILQLSLWEENTTDCRLTGIDEDGYLTADVPADCAFSVDNVKPYLRPLSSMTEEEKKKYNNLKNQFVCRVQDNNGIHYVVDIDEDSFKLYDWLNVHHFDYRGLILKGLAIAVTKENNPYEKEQKEKQISTSRKNGVIQS